MDSLLEMLARVSAVQEKRWNALHPAGAKEKTAPKTRQQIVQELRRQQAFRSKDPAAMTIAELVELYGSGMGGDDAAGPELKRRGAKAMDELIHMLDHVPDPEDPNLGVLIQILMNQFPSEKLYAALDRLDSRMPHGVPGFGVERTLAELRAKLNGQYTSSWWDEAPDKSDCERTLSFDELLLANCRPADRMVFLVAAAKSALEAFQDARRLFDKKLQAVNSTKATAHAREILAAPEASQTAEGVYYANHVLGMLAFYRGNMAKAKDYLIRSSEARLTGFESVIRDWSLAESLLGLGERSAVSACLDHTKAAAAGIKESRARDRLLERWKKTIAAGGAVDFREWLRLKG